MWPELGGGCQGAGPDGGKLFPEGGGTEQAGRLEGGSSSHYALTGQHQDWADTVLLRTLVLEEVVRRDPYGGPSTLEGGGMTRS